MSSTSPTTVRSSPATEKRGPSTNGWIATSPVGRILNSRPLNASGYASRCCAAIVTRAALACSTVTPGRRRPFTKRLRSVRVFRRSRPAALSESNASDIMYGIHMSMLNPGAVKL